MGAGSVVPSLSPIVGQVLFAIGVSGLVLYPIWRFQPQLSALLRDWGIHSSRLLIISILFYASLCVGAWYIGWWVATPPPITVAPTEPAEPPTSRVFVDIDKSHIRSLYADLTVLQADKILAPYIGKWTTVAGILNDVRDIAPVGLFIMFKESDGITFVMTFDSVWRDQLSLLRRGDRLSVTGRIHKISDNAIELDHCELVGK